MLNFLPDTARVVPYRFYCRKMIVWDSIAHVTSAKGYHKNCHDYRMKLQPLSFKQTDLVSCLSPLAVSIELYYLVPLDVNKH